MEDDRPNEHPVLQGHNASYTTNTLSFIQNMVLNSARTTEVCLTPNIVPTHKVITGTEMAFHQKYVMDS